MSTTARAVPAFIDRHYTVYLVIIALAGWALASYDFNLLVITMPDIADSLHLSSARVGLLGFLVYGAMFIATLFTGYAMDTVGRKNMWMVCLTGAALFTGLTYFVQNYWQLALVRALASGLAISELAISITLVNEQVDSARRGLLYSIVQGGWPVGLFLASGVYLAFHGWGWRVVFALGVVPLVIVIIGRYWVRESERFEHLQAVKQAKASGDDSRMDTLLEQYDVDVSEVDKITVKQLFVTPGVIRQRIVLLSIVWLFYSVSFVATNVYIAYWLTHYYHWSGSAASTLLLVSSGIGFFFYIIGGALGERFGRKNVLVVSGILVAPLNLAFMFLHSPVLVSLVYFLIYQVTNGTWSGTGYAYWAECFPTRVRGTAIGWLGAMNAAGYFLGALLWTVLIGLTSAPTTWLIIAVGVALGMWLTLLLPRIEPGMELESIST